MVLQRLKAAFGAGVEVDTIFPQPIATPGGKLHGEVHLRGGGADHVIEAINLELQATNEIHTQEGLYHRTISLYQIQVVGHSELPANSRRTERFEIELPWETPISAIGRDPVPGLELGIATELALSHAMDKTDSDLLHVVPTPGQDKILDTLTQLGFVLGRADVEDGTLEGSVLPVFQELEYEPSKQFENKFDRLEVTFISRKDEMDVIFEVNERGRIVGDGIEAACNFRVKYDQLEVTDWRSIILEKLNTLG